MTTLCQMEIFNFLWLNWVQYLPLAPTQIDIPPSYPQGGVQIYPSANLLKPNSRKKVFFSHSNYLPDKFYYILTFQIHTLQMFAGNCRDSTGKLECRDFKFMGNACIPAIPVILKSPHSGFHVKIVGILNLQGYYRDTPH